MFTGIVAASGEVTAARTRRGVMKLTIKAPAVARALKRGDSVSVDGVCLTARTARRRSFEADVMDETLSRTTLGRLRRGRRVNLELPARLADRIGGHLVQGHVDATAEVVAVDDEGGTRRMWLAAPRHALRYLVPQGSVAVNGSSLTIVEVSSDGFQVALIPHTLEVTNLGELGVGSTVNIEVDVVGKYIERLMEGS
ncbi:MAG: riboflavin synthase [Actinomycetota bacterium]